jgi:hypothetical protein
VATRTALAAPGIAPRLLTREQAAASDCPSAALSEWVKTGGLPGPIRSTTRWDQKAIHTALDRASGLQATHQPSSLEEWKAGAMRVNLRGVNRSAVRLASGQVKTYWGAWVVRLEGEPASPEFVRSYSAAHAARIQARGGTEFTLIAEFKTSAEYQGLRPSIQRAYAAYLKLVEQEFGDLPIEALSDPAVRGEFKSWRDTMMSTPPTMPGLYWRVWSRSQRTTAAFR